MKLKTYSGQGFLPHPAVKVLRNDVQSLFDDLDAVVTMQPPQRPHAAAPASDSIDERRRLQRLQERAVLLEVQTEELALNLGRLEEQQSESRAREVFDLIDISGDGVIQLDEFQRAARCLIDDECKVDPDVPCSSSYEDTDAEEVDQTNGLVAAAQIAILFNEADTDRSGGLDFIDFQKLLKSLWSDTRARLRAELQEALPRLCTALLACSELELTARLEEGSARECSDLVEQWCVLEQRVVMAGTSPLRLPELEILVNETKALAASLSLHTSGRGLGYRSRVSLAVRQAIKSGRKTFRFCWRGLSITSRDVCQSVWMLRRPVFMRTPLAPEDWALAKQTVTDLIWLIPYTVIMIIPMSPPGHVFAFSLLNRCFPGAVPSGFTLQRQDLDEIFDLATGKTPALAVQVAMATAVVLLLAAAAVAGH